MHIVLGQEIQTKHDKAYITKRICDSRDDTWVLMCASNDCMVQTEQGLELARAGDCFIKAPGFIEYHYAPDYSEQGFINDWMHIKSAGMEEMMGELGLPQNTIIKTNHPELIRNSLQKIITEKQNLQPYNQNYISNIVDNILIKIARASAESNYGDSKKYHEELLDLRIDMLNHLEKNWTISKMAEYVGLSSSRFSVLYKKRFGLSPTEDLINMRIDKARLLLLSTNMKLYHIAQVCGFKNEYYFSRMFKERENLTPGFYRRNP